MSGSASEKCVVKSGQVSSGIKTRHLIDRLKGIEEKVAGSGFLQTAVPR
jgi:hypothetical protein